MQAMVSMGKRQSTGENGDGMQTVQKGELVSSKQSIQDERKASR
jgi:hypothetical protein